MARSTGRHDEVSPPHGIGMVDPERLSTATGQLGPKCAKTGKPLKFSEAIVHDGEYLSYEAYLEVTGAESSTQAQARARAKDGVTPS